MSTTHSSVGGDRSPHAKAVGVSGQTVGFRIGATREPSLQTTVEQRESSRVHDSLGCHATHVRVVREVPAAQTAASDRGRSL